MNASVSSSLLLATMLMVFMAVIGIPQHRVFAQIAELDALCDWAGTWDTTYGTMHLVQVGDEVTGTYDYSGGQIEGFVWGEMLIGTWAEAPTYSPPTQAGEFEFNMTPDCDEFTGEWWYGDGAHGGYWNGTLTVQSLQPLLPHPCQRPRCLRHQ